MIAEKKRIMAAVLISAFVLICGCAKKQEYMEMSTVQPPEENQTAENVTDPEPKKDIVISAAPTDQAETTEAEINYEIRLVFGGDVYLSDHVLNAYDRAGGLEGMIDDALLENMKQADLFVVNEEFPFGTTGTPAPDKQYTFRIAPERATIMKDLGIDLVTLANNHALDYGRDALAETFDTLDRIGMQYMGAGRNLDEAMAPVIVEIMGQKIGFLAATRVVPDGSWTASSSASGMLMTYDPALLLEQVAKTKEICDTLFVYLHWGIERNEKPEEYERQLGKQLIDAGADAVIGSHPHVLQGIEYYHGKPIVYSLGNLIFGSSIPQGALLEITVTKEDMKLTLQGLTSHGGYTKTMTGMEEKTLFARLNNLCVHADVSEEGIVNRLEEE